MTRHDQTHARHLEDRLRRVQRYMNDNPAGDLSLDRLAEVAAMSRFHWHRVFRAMTGETCGQAVRRIRAMRSAHWLVETNWPVEEVAAAAGYENPRSFARAFRDYFGMTPHAFRQANVPPAALPHFDPAQEGDHPMTRKVTIENRDTTRLVGLTHTGAYNQISKAYGEVSAVMSARNLWRHARGMAAVYFDDPSQVPEAELRSFAGVVVDTGFDLPDALEEHLQPEGRYAQMLVEGPYTQLPEAYAEFYGPWLSQSGEVPRDAPSFEVYLNDPTDTKPEDLKTLICMPLQDA